MSLSQHARHRYPSPPQVHLHAFSKRGASHDAAMVLIKLFAASTAAWIDDPLALSGALVLVALCYLPLGLRNPPYYRSTPNELRVAVAVSVLVASLLG